MFARVRGCSASRSGSCAADVAQDREQRSQRFRLVDIGRTMEGDHAVAARQVECRRLDSGAAQRLGHGDRQRPVRQERVDHHVADEMGARRIDALAREVVMSRALGRVEQIRDLVGQHPVDLLRHRAVETSQPRLHVRHRHALLHRDQRAGERRIDVADDEDAGGMVRVEHRLEAPHHFGRLHRMRSGTDLQVDVRWRQTEAREQLIVHVDIVVLARMDEHRRQHRIVHGERAQNGRHLHEVGTCTHHAKHGAGGGEPRIPHHGLTCFLVACGRTASSSCCSKATMVSARRSRRVRRSSMGSD